MDWLSTEAWGGIAAGALAAFFGVKKAWEKYRRPILQKRSEASIALSAEVMFDQRALLAEWCSSEGVMRVMSKVAKNGGMPWPPDKPLFVSCLDQVPNRVIGVHNTWKRWRSWECDPSYRGMLHEIMSKGDRGLLIKTANMYDTTLADHYSSQGTVASILFKAFLVPKEHALIYVSIDYGHPRIADLLVQIRTCADNDDHKKADQLADERNELIAYYTALAERAYSEPDHVRSMSVELANVWSKLHD